MAIEQEPEVDQIGPGLGGVRLRRTTQNLLFVVGVTSGAVALCARMIRWWLLAAESIKCPRVSFFDQRFGAGLRATAVIRKIDQALEVPSSTALRNAQMVPVI